MSKLVQELNTINTPWIAILVMLIGCIFAVVSKIYGLNSDMASGVIGAGIGLATGQGLKPHDPGTPGTPTAGAPPPAQSNQ